MLTKSYFFISTIIFSLSLFAEPMNRSNQYLSAKKIVNNLCVACHAVDGNSAISMNPKLAGQHSAYITKQLMNFKSGTRENAVMAGMVASLNDEDMKIDFMETKYPLNNLIKSIKNYDRNNQNLLKYFQ